MQVQRVYSPNQATLGTFLGGPLAGLFYIKHNFKALNRPEQEQQTLRWGGVLMVVLLAVLPFIPEQVPGTPFAVAFVVLARSLVEKYQFDKAAIAQSPQLDFQSNWLVLGVAIISITVFLLISFAVIFALSAAGLIEL